METETKTEEFKPAAPAQPVASKPSTPTATIPSTRQSTTSKSTSSSQETNLFNWLGSVLKGTTDGTTRTEQPDTQAPGTPAPAAPTPAPPAPAAPTSAPTPVPAAPQPEAAQPAAPAAPATVVQPGVKEHLEPTEAQKKDVISIEYESVTLHDTFVCVQGLEPQGVHPV